MRNFLIIFVFFIPCCVLAVDFCGEYYSPGNTYDHCEDNPRGYGNCTWWGAYKRTDMNFPDSGRDAKNWVSFADKYFFTIDQSPSIGSIITFSNGKHGHLAYVEGIGNDGSVHVTEMGWDWFSGVQTSVYKPVEGGYRRHNGNYLEASIWLLVGFIRPTRSLKIENEEFKGALRFDGGDGAHGRKLTYCEDGTNFVLYYSLSGESHEKLYIDKLSDEDAKATLCSEIAGSNYGFQNVNLGSFRSTFFNDIIVGDGRGGLNIPISSIGPNPLLGKRSDTRPDFDIYNTSGSELSAKSDTYIPKSVNVGQRIRLQLETQVDNADVEDSLRDDDSDSIEGPIWWRIETNGGNPIRGWSLAVSEEFDVDDLDKGDSPDEEEWFTVPNYAGKTIVFAACTDGDDEVWEEDESSTRRKATSPSNCGTNNRSRDEKLRIAYTKPSVASQIAASVLQTSATFRGTFNAQGTPTYGYFDYGTSGNFGQTVYLGNIGSSNNPITKASNVGGLACGTVYYYRARATNQGGTRSGKTQSFRTMSCPGASTNIVPVYGFWSKKVTGHHMTTSEGGKDNLINHPTWDWVYEGVYYYALNKQLNNALPVYRFWRSGDLQHHMYTMFESERSVLIADPAWTEERIEFYAYPNQRPGTVPIHRYYSRYSSDHYFPQSAPSHYNSNCNHTGRKLNGKNALSSTNYNHCYEGVAWYTYPSLPRQTSIVSTEVTSTRTGASINISYNPNGTQTSLFLEYGTTIDLGSTVAIGGVGFGATESIHSVVIPNLICGTAYYYRVKAINDAGESVTEIKTFFTEDCLMPDLVISSFNLSNENIEPNTEIDLKIGIKNIGEAPALTSTVEIYMAQDEDSLFDFAPIMISSVTALDINNVRLMTIKRESPEVEGKYWYGACVRTSESESDIDNNCSKKYLLEVVEDDFLITYMPTIITAIISQKDNLVGQSCGTELIYDCSGNCVNEINIQQWVGDGFCDDQESIYNMNLMCSFFQFDGGDCLQVE